jgi:glycosyltransferase involved in cell wall biosynthesis
VNRVVLVANEPIWPVRSGGTARMAGLITALARALAVPVETIEPGLEAAAEHEGIKRTPLAMAPSNPLTELLSPRPRLARTSLGGRPADALDLVDDDTVVIVSHSYLAPPLLQARPNGLVVDFPNVEVDRQRSLGSMVAKVEAAKATRWEPLVARQARLCLAVDLTEAARLAAWGARVVVVPNAVDAVEATPSPEDGPAVVVANASYGPNAEGLRWLVDEVWPLVKRQRPEAALVIAGTATHTVVTSQPDKGITVLGRVDDANDLVRRAAIVLAPVKSGGGTQLKVVEALALGRAIVATTYSSRSIPEGARSAAAIADRPADFAAATVTLLADLGQRRKREHVLQAGTAVPTWDAAVRPLAADLSRRLGR